MDKSQEKEACAGKDHCTDHEKHGGSSDMTEIFASFSRFGERESDGETITLKNIDKWFNQAGLMKGSSKITGPDTAITFSKIAKTKKRLDVDEFNEFLEQLAKDKNMEVQEFRDKLIAAGQPGFTNVTETESGEARANVERMTDTSLYTGIHKERFDEEGRGRGIEGREEVVDTSGYVQGFREMNDRTKTPDGKTKTPDDRTKTPDGRTKTPDDRTKTPDGETKTPDDRTKTPDGETKTPDDKTKTPDGKTKTPDDETKTLDDKNKKA